jgi:hypothetical protein
VLAFLNLDDGPLEQIRPRLQRLSDSVSDDWTRRAYADLDCGRLGATGSPQGGR